MSTQAGKSIIQLKNPLYVPVIKDSSTFYGGSQMWFSNERKSSTDYILHNYGCGTIAVADLFLYLACQNKKYRNSITDIAMQGTDTIHGKDYLSYVLAINKLYTHTKKHLAVLGPKAAKAVNSYGKDHKILLRAKWKLKLSYYDMLYAIEEMLLDDIPVILSVGPNFPNLLGKKGISFYQDYKALDWKELINQEGDANKPTKRYLYKEVIQNMNSHYVTVTAIKKDDIAGAVMLRISSWGKQYYIDYEEYRDYISAHGSTLTSSILYITS